MAILVIMQGLTEVLRNLLFLFFHEEAPEEHVEPTGGAI